MLTGSPGSFEDVFMMLAARLCFVTALVVCLTGWPGHAANSVPVKPAPFIDIDGDGFSDADPDDNGNGIPDRFENISTESSASALSLLGNVFNANLNASAEAAPALSRSAAFGKREFQSRPISLHRGGLNAMERFGPGSDIGIGNLTSGCEGGVCH